MTLTILKHIAQIGFIIVILLSIFHWIRIGFWAPKYIHYFAIVAFIIGCFLLYTAESTGDTNLSEYMYLTIGLPVIVYAIYGIYGLGVIRSINIEMNSDFVIDRTMLKDEVVEIIKENFTPYLKWDYENLLLLSANKHQTELKGKSGREYMFEISSEPYEDKDNGSIIIIVGKLTELKRSFYKPRSHIVFEIGRDGTIYRDGLNINT